MLTALESSNYSPQRNSSNYREHVSWNPYNYYAKSQLAQILSIQQARFKTYKVTIDRASKLYIIHNHPYFTRKPFSWGRSHTCLSVCGVHYGAQCSYCAEKGLYNETVNSAEMKLIYG